MTDRAALVPEQMDADDADPRQLEQALRFIRRINAILGYNRRVVREVAALAAGRMSLSVLDVACGSGDLCHALRRWADRRHVALNAVGLDRHLQTCLVAKSLGTRVVRGDALGLPFADASFDIVTCNLFLHHLPNHGIARVLAELSRVSRVGFVVADLLRNRRAAAWIWLFTRLSDPMTRHDAVTSVRQAFSRSQARQLAMLVEGFDVSVRVTPGHRFVLIGRRANRPPVWRGTMIRE